VILVTGGARSGKSTLAERLATELSGRVLYVATAEPGDDEMRLRIERHRARRPSEWGTLAAPRDAVRRLEEIEGQWDTILFDCLTLYTTNLLLERERESPDPEVALAREMQDLADYLARSWPQAVVVTNEVGTGIVPADRLSRLFRDLQGRVNQVFARAADEVYLCVSGIPLKIKGPGSPWATADTGADGSSPTRPAS
jgi:adenosylcobinamide kinase/adenosylcobinamide-phosphate guanylyltransferase